MIITPVAKHCWRPNHSRSYYPALGSSKLQEAGAGNGDDDDEMMLLPRRIPICVAKVR